MRTLSIFLFLVLSLAACTPSTTPQTAANNTATTANRTMPAVPFAQRWIIAVPDFRVAESNITIQGRNGGVRATPNATANVRANLAEIARTLAETFSVAAVNKQQFRVTERAVLDAILREQNLSTSGIISPETASEIGRVSGTELLVLGSLNEMRLMPSTDDVVSAVVDFFEIKTDTVIVDVRVRLELRAVAVNTAEIVAAVRAEATLEDIEISVGNNKKQDLALTSKGSDALRQTIEAAVRQGVVKLARALPAKN